MSLRLRPGADEALRDIVLQLNQYFARGDFPADTSASAPVDSVNGQTGTVVLDADDIDDTSTTNKFADAASVAAAGAIMDSDVSANGLIARTSAGAYAARTLTAGTGISITNANGVSGNPTISATGASLVAFKTYFTNFDIQASTGLQSGFNTSPAINQGSFSVSTSRVTVPETATYLITVNISLESTVVRAAPNCYLLNGSTAMGERMASGYIRASSQNKSSLHLSALYSLTASDQIGLYAEPEGAAGTVDVIGSESSISILKVG